MSEKDTTQKVVTKYDKKVQKRKEEEKKQNRNKKITMLVGIVVAVACVIGLVSIPVSKYMAAHSTYVTIGGEAVTPVEFDYYYHASVNDYVSQYGSYLSYLGLDTSKDMSQQQYSEDMTWKDFFEQTAVNTIRKTKALVSEGKANGFTHDDSKELETHMTNLKEAAETAETSLKNFYKATYGKYATGSNVKQYLKDALYAAAYYSQVAESKAPSDEEITTYYNENKDSYDSVDYRLTEVAAEFEEKAAADTTDTAADGADAAAAEPTEEEITAAMAIAKTEADAKLETVAKEGELKENLTKDSINSLYSGWLFDGTRKAGDTTIVEDTTNHKYFVLAFEKRYLDETPTGSVRVIMTAEAKGEDIINEFNTNGATEDAFIALVERYSEDEYTNMTGGLYEGLSKTGLNENMSAWVFDGSRKAGDVTSMVMEDGSTYVMYFVGEGKPKYTYTIKSALVSESMQQYLEEIMTPYEVADTKGNLNYLKVTAPESTAPTETETVPETETAVPSTESGK